MCAVPSESYLNRQVEMLSQPEARAALRSLKAMWSIGEPAPPAPIEIGPGPATLVGIWERTREADGCTSFVRAPELASSWDAWADVHRIPAKSARRRIVLIGESVARGFFFDPGFTVAQALQSVLDGVAGRDRTEVVDLASASLQLSSLVTLAQQAPALQPDAVVIFCGNNWRTASTPSLSTVRRAARAGALVDGGITALKARCEDELAEDVDAALTRIAAVFAPLKTPVVVVVPEFNLVDWREWDATPGWLQNGGNAEWLSMMCRAREALRAGASDAARTFASRLVEIDGGTCACSFYLLADAMEQQGGSREERRRLLERARDCSVWDPSPLLSPRTFSVVQTTLRTRADALGLHVVDLPAALDAYSGDDGLPDRRLFLDYCHLTKEGMQVTAAAMASSILPLIGQRAVSTDALLGVPLKMKKPVEAVAHFSAAIHNARWGQSREVVEHHCARALALSRDVASMMEDYIDLSTRRAPAWMCSALDRLADRDELALVRYMISTLPATPKLVDRDLLGAVAATLGGDVEERLESLWCDEHGGDGARVALHEPFCAIRSLNQREATAFVHPPAEWPDLLRAYSRESTFSLLEARPRDVELCLTARLPRECTTAGEIVIVVNGVPVFSGTVGRQWTTWRVTVPAECVRRGVNELRVWWPQPAWESTTAMSRAIEAIESAATPELFPAFGEIHSFWAENH